MLTMRGKTLRNRRSRSRARRRGLEVKDVTGGIHGNNLGHYMVVAPATLSCSAGASTPRLEIPGYLADIEPGRDCR